MSSCLIGHTGFVGSSLLRTCSFDVKVNRANLETLTGTEFNRIVCAGLPAEKWKANLEPSIDLRNTERLVQALDKADARTFVLISTVDVYGQLIGCSEGDTCPMGTHPYGKHRLQLEDFVRERFKHHLILRLPALFGIGLKKNILFDLLHNNQVEKIDPNTSFQWYPVSRLSDDIDCLLSQGFNGIINLCPEPISTRDLISTCFPKVALTARDAPGIAYDIRSNFVSKFGRVGSYIESKENVLQQIQAYIREYSK